MDDAHGVLLGAALSRWRTEADNGVHAPAQRLAAVESWSETLTDAGRPALGQVCAIWFQCASSLVTREGEGLDAAFLDEWPALLHAYITGSGEQRDATSLVEHLGDARWPDPLPPEDAALVLDMVLDEMSQSEPAEVSLVDSDDGSCLTESALEADHPFRQLCELLRAELEQLNGALTADIHLADDATQAATARRDARQHVLEQLACFADAAESVGLNGLATAYTTVLSALEVDCIEDARPKHRLADVCSMLSATSLSWLDAPFAQHSSLALTNSVKALAHNADVDALHALLTTPHTPTVDDPDKTPRARLAGVADVDLSLPDDVDPELLDSLLAELPVRTEEFSQAVQQIVAHQTLEDLELAQRAAHTVKGAANTVGIAGLANLTHHAEDILEQCVQHGSIPQGPLAELLIDVADTLECMSETLQGQGAPPANALEILQSLLDWANSIDESGLPPGRSPVPVTPTAQPTASSHEIVDSPDALSPMSEETHTPPSPQESASVGQATVRVPATHVDELMRLVGETMMLTGQIHEHARRAVARTRALHTEFSRFQKLGYELEQLIDVSDLAVPRLRLVDKHFDALELDNYSELYSVGRRLSESALDARELGRDVESVLGNLDDLLVEQGRLNRETHEAVLRTRMVPVRNIFPRLARGVRQAARLTKKEVALDTTGDETLIDSDLLSEVVDPLMHVLRNAVDHGIESPEVRLASDKPPVGKVQVHFSREGNQVVIRCHDDGAGLDEAAIRARAIALGLPTPADVRTDVDLTPLLVSPGFSTRDVVTQTSGRGVGLDAVWARVTQLGGMFSLTNREGGGCTAQMHFPLTVLSTHAVIVRAQHQVLALTDRGLEQLLPPSAADFQYDADNPTLTVNDIEYPVVTLNALLNYPPDRRRTVRAPRYPLLVRGPDGLCVVVVEEVIDTRDIVVKSMGPLVAKPHGVIGATILGDGAVTPVLDLAELLRPSPRANTPGYTRGPSVDTATKTNAAPVDATQPTALVVDDSLSARRALSRFMEDAGYRVRSARDGMEAVDILQGLRPDVVLLDLEMPRMNGLELTSHIRAHADFANLPVIMVTSRSTRKHQDLAHKVGVSAFLTKPFSESDLLDQIESLRKSA
ncbi:MAG: response regulator [Gammaproteobacteria bacterium]|nr:response regulator [Gammaproteobacteria bacterium]